MTRQLSISDTGLRLIKAFEGYRPVDRELITGARVVGYGHRVHDERPRAMTRDEADSTLKLDLAAYEEMINEEVHAPLSQSQFDALCSLAFNIGPKAFRESDTLRALNNGRVLDAANGFDIWRKARVNGEIYVVDALMRRRTAEKSLFLRTEASVPAPAAMLEPEADHDVAALDTDDGLPVFSEDMRTGVVAKVGYEAVPNPRRRREDQEPGILTLSEVIAPDVDAPDTQTVTEADDDEVPPANDLSEDGFAANAQPVETVSPVREAADAIAERLDALIDGDDTAPDTSDWPQSLIQPVGPDTEDIDTPTLPATQDSEAVLVPFPTTETRLTAKDMVDTTGRAPLRIDNLAADDVLRDSRPAEGPVYVAPDAEQSAGLSGLWIPVVLGFALLGASATALWRGAEALLGEWGPLMALAGAITGLLMVLFALYLATVGRMADE